MNDRKSADKSETQLRAWQANYLLNISIQGAESVAFAEAELASGGVRILKLRENEFAVVIETGNGHRLEGIADHSSARSVAKAFGSAVPSDGLLATVGTAPAFSFDQGPVAELVGLVEAEAGQRAATIRAAKSAASVPRFPVTTGFEIPGYRIVALLDIVSGATVRTRHLGSKLVAGVSQNFGGELPGFTRLLNEARAEAMQRMIAHAMERGADAIIGFSFATSDVFDGSAEVLAFGTAVRTEPDESPEVSE